MKKHILKLRPLLLLMVLFVLANCQEDLYDTSRVQLTNESKAVLLRGKEAQEQLEIAMASLNKNGGNGMAMLKSRINANITYDPALRKAAEIVPYIDGSEVAKVTSYDGSINYTFRVGLSDTSADRFYNFIVTNKGSQQKLMLITYNLSKEFSAAYISGAKNFSQFSGTISFDNIDGEEDDPCLPPPGIPINGGGGGGATGGGGSGGTGGGGVPNIPPPILIDTPNPRPQDVALKFNAIAISPITIPIVATPIDGPAYPAAGGGSGGTINLPPLIGFSLNIPGFANNPNHNPCFDPVLIGILEPVDPETAFINNCNELDNFVNKTVAHLNSMKDVENTSSDTDEDGYSYSDNKAPQVLAKEPSTGNVLVKVPSGGLIYGASHDHPNPDTTEWIPMFSISDIASLGLMAAKYQGTPKKYEKFVFTLSINKGGGKHTYALKIDDWSQFSWFVNEYYSSGDVQEKHRKKLGGLYSKVSGISGPSTYLNVLFKYMNDYGIKGISIYEADDSEFNSWSRLAYNPANNNFTKVPCK